MDGFSSFFDLISLFCGGYILVTWVKLRVAGRLFPNGLLIPKNKTVKDCLDAPGYIRYVSPRLLIVGVIVTLSGVLGLLNGALQLYGVLVSEIFIMICLAVLVWYAICTVRANKRFW